MQTQTTLDKMIQKARGSRKRQLMSLRNQQLSNTQETKKVSWAEFRQDILNGNDGHGNADVSQKSDCERKLENERDAWMQRAIVAEQTVADWQLFWNRRNP